MIFFRGGNGQDTLYGGPGTDTLNGLTNNDILDGGPGADTLNGGGGTDTASYLSARAGVTANLDAPIGNNTGDAAGDTYSSIENLTGSGFDDRLTGDFNANIIRGSYGDDQLRGDRGNDTLYGDEGDDFLDGERGADILYGGDGDDVLIEGSEILFIGRDILWGGAGNDVFVITFQSSNQSSNSTIIKDFTAGEDKIRFDGGYTFTTLSGGFLKLVRQGTDHVAIQNTNNRTWAIIENIDDATLALMQNDANFATYFEVV